MVIVLFSCRKSYECNKQDEITYENIPDSNISQIPYTGNELISFVNETGDTAVFKCTGYKNYYSTVKKSEGSNGCTYWDITKTQQIDFTFIDTANVNRSFRVMYEAAVNSVENASSTTIYFFSPHDLLKVARGINYFYNPIHSDSLITSTGKIIHGSFMEKDLGIFFNINNGIISFEDQFQNKWTILN